MDKTPVSLGALRRSWAFTLAGGVLLVFTTIAIPRVVRRELKNQANQATSDKK